MLHLFLASVLSKSTTSTCGFHLGSAWVRIWAVISAPQPSTSISQNVHVLGASLTLHCIRKSYHTTLCAWKSVESTSRSESSTVVKNNLYLRRLRPNYHFSGMGSSLGRRFDLRQLRPEVGTTTRSQPKQYQISFSNLSWFGRIRYALTRVVVILGRGFVVGMLVISLLVSLVVFSLS